MGKEKSNESFIARICKQIKRNDRFGCLFIKKWNRAYGYKS
uniref:Uncharacterized protein n=1 Tax=Grateloupia filicina TaxID=31455 RepID=A0A2S1FXH2_9FLOR|nr:hypothetical protein Grafi_p169 [Grateloupia filicina]AWD77466.1 hypothetical protein Grafi_p169 [Grateloupia filicina]